jgi:membrane protein
MTTATATATTPADSAAMSKQDQLPASTGIWDMLKQTLKDFSEDNAMRLAAAMACYIMLALAPMLVISLKIVSWVYADNPGRAGEVVGEQVTHLIGPAGGEAISEMIKSANKGGGGTFATIVSLLIVLFSASGLFVSLQDALNTIWEVKPKPDAGWWQWIRKRFLSMGMVLGIGVLLLSSMAVTTVLGIIVRSIFGGEDAGPLAYVAAYVVDFVVTVGVSWVLFIGVFKFLPDVKIGWRDVWIGALVTAVLFKLGQIGMALYFKYGSATSAYGTFGSIVAVLLWAYYSSIIMFLGAEFTQVWARVHGREFEPEPHAVKVTADERARQGIAGEARVAAMAEQQSLRGPSLGPPKPMPVGHVPATRTSAQVLADEQRPYTFGAAGAAVGAAVAGLATWYIDQRRLTRKQVAAAELKQRINAVEAKIGRVSRLKDYLEQMDVKERIDRVEAEIHRAGRHVRARETGRPLWMVQLGDLIGGRWSKV